MMQDVADTLKVSRSAIYRALQREREFEEYQQMRKRGRAKPPTPRACTD